MEPTPETLMEIGRLCLSWSVLESATETTIWGILDADSRLGSIITWRLDLRNRWQLLLEHAYKKHIEKDVKFLKIINKLLVDVTRDRNIIIHGLVHSAGKMKEDLPPNKFLNSDDFIYTLPPSWTIFRGADAGKNFEVSKNSVQIVSANIDVINRALGGFNMRHGYGKTSVSQSDPEQNWPKPISL